VISLPGIGCLEKRDHNMNNKNNAPNHPAVCDAIEAHIAPFIDGLKTTGYAVGTLSTKRSALRKFVGWRRRLRNPDAEPDESEVTEFLEKSCHLGKAHRCLASTALSGFLEHLRRHEVIATCAPKAQGAIISRLERSYADFLRNEKGLAELSLLVYLPVVQDLLDYLQKKHGTTAVRRLDATILRSFLLERAQDRSSEYVRLLATSLRSLLRFLHLRGLIRKGLTAAIPTVRRWRQPDVPQKLTPAEVAQVLEAPDRKTAAGRRDYAILLLLARLGLRASEVLSLELQDRGKGSRLDVLPLPRDVGAAIARYLRLDCGVRTAQRVFLRTYAPRVPLTGPASIGHIVRHSMAHAGVDRPKQIAAHLFRHTLASRMLQQGANLRDISEVLRHRAVSSTEIYAKIDMRSLNEVMRPWPAGGGAR
jgi:integrase/recombinase XerD